MGTSFSSPHRPTTTTTNEPQLNPHTSNNVAEYDAADTDDDAFNTQDLSPTHDVANNSEGSSPTQCHTTTSSRKRKQTDFLSPTFTPQKRSNRTEITFKGESGSERKVYPKYDTKWENNYALLKQYKEEHDGSCCKVPPSYKVDGVLLGKWIENQKYFYKRNKLLQERYDKLSTLGVIFPPPKIINEEDNATEGGEDEDENGDDNKGLFATLFSPSPSKKKKVKNEEAQATPPSSSWETYLQQLKSYRDTTGTTTIPPSHPNQHLYKWCENQRMFYHMNKLSSERIVSLNDIGFTFTKTRTQKWQCRYEELCMYKEENGTTNVPQSYGPLGRWVSKQRQYYKAKTLSVEQYKKLKDIGFCWDAPIPNSKLEELNVLDRVAGIDDRE